MQNTLSRLTITGTPGSSGIIQVSSDLQTWSDLASFANETGSFEYQDDAAADVTVRFYRIIQN
jgi:hypothetical protein